MAATTNSIDGDIIGNPSSKNISMWIVKLNDTAAIEWQKCFSNDFLDNAPPVGDICPEGGYICIGNIGTAMIITKFAENGKILWRLQNSPNNAYSVVARRHNFIGGATVTFVGNHGEDGPNIYHSSGIFNIIDGQVIPQSITFKPIPAKTVCNTDFYPTIYSNKGTTLTSSNTNVAAIVNNKIHVIKPGICTITATAPGDAYFLPATPQSQILTITSPATMATITDSGFVEAYNFRYDTTPAKHITNTVSPIGFDNNPAISPVMPLPFKFYYGGSYYASFSVNANGLLRFGDSALHSSDYSGNMPDSLLQKTIMVWAAPNLGFGSNGNVRYKTIGDEGARKLVIEWNINTGGSGSYDRTMQAWLFEGTNIIQLLYGPPPAADTVYAKTGIVNSPGDFQVVNTTLNTASSINASFTGRWPVNTSYIFTPPATALADSGTAKTFYAAVANGGLYPHFSWMKNGLPVGDNNYRYTDSLLQEGDSIWCVVKGSDTGCLASPKVISNKIIIGDASVLPVTFKNFTAQKQQSNALLTWQTATEVNSKQFNVQRSLDGARFSTIGTVKAAGHNTILRQYTFIDNAALKLSVPVLYYRIQEQDNDGHYNYSKVATLALDNSKAYFTIAPNPVHNSITIRSTANAKAMVRITDMGGRILYSSAATFTAGGITGIPAQRLARGIYIVSIQGEGVKVSMKVVKQ